MFILLWKVIKIVHYIIKLKNVEVRAGSTAGLTNEVVGLFERPGTSPGVHVIPFRKTVTARFITIQILGTGILQINGLRINQLSPKGKIEFLNKWF